MIQTTISGFPRIGLHRETKKGLEKYWKKSITLTELEQITRDVRLWNWRSQHEHGIHILPSNDFTLYDQMLDTICMLGAIPPRFQSISSEFDLQTYFAMARGKQENSIDIPAMEMTKWFNTNYHFIVPEIEPTTTFHFTYRKVIEEYLEARRAGFQTRPVIIGPLTFLLLSKSDEPDFNALDKLNSLIPVYEQVLQELYQAGAEWVQIDEPALVKDTSPQISQAIEKAYRLLTASPHRPRILLSAYFDDWGDNFHTITRLPIDGIHFDLASAPGQWTLLQDEHLEGKRISLGVINGHNVWRADLNALYATITKHLSQRKGDYLISTSCSLQHVPLDVGLEEDLAQPVKNWLAFALQKMDEISALAHALRTNEKSDLFTINQKALQQRREYIENQRKQSPLSSTTVKDTGRQNPHTVRQGLQQKKLDLPLFPTTTIGSFPQTRDVRSMRSRYSKGEISLDTYNQFLRGKIKESIHLQKEMGLDVLVHGEFERNDMVQYFAEQMEGFTFTKHGWVQSFGSRYVRPPIIFADISRPKPMTIEWISYAQSLTTKPVKGMLTGPVTILQWSFVRDDQPRAQTCQQIAHAIRMEVDDLQKAGINIIQIDEPALREGLPLKRKNWETYLRWAIKAFQIAAGSATADTQIHTHMCYSEFNEIIDSIAALDADVISIEAARSKMELLNAFAEYDYPNQIGPGVYDIHSPRVPGVQEMIDLLERAARVIPVAQLWVNPDCGLKTRGWEETSASLKNMVAAAKFMRQHYQDKEVL